MPHNLDPRALVVMRLFWASQAQADGSNEPGTSERPSVAVTNGIASEIVNGYTMNVHNGDLSYAE